VSDSTSRRRLTSDFVQGFVVFWQGDVAEIGIPSGWTPDFRS
jgi:hypothetical protein